MDELVLSYSSGTQYCRRCDRHFKDRQSIFQHFVNSRAHDYCERCDRAFVDDVAKIQHLSSSSRHNICHLQVCRKQYSNGADFHSRAALLDHFREDRDHFYCFSCGNDFGSGEDRREHWRRTVYKHYLCSICENSFATSSQLQQHCEGRSAHFLCELCDVVFNSQEKLSLHFISNQNHHWCSKCEREFVSDAALTHHRLHNSMHYYCGICHSDYCDLNQLVQHQKVHQPLTVECACPLRFGSFSALMIHWEAGGCTTNRLFLNRLVLSFPGHKRFIVPEFICHLNGTQDRVRRSDEKDYYYYENAWVCPIGDCKGRYPSRAMLDQHLGSPYHDVNAFKCPNTDCDARFSCLSGLLQHVENSMHCSEGVNSGTGCLGRLWLFLLERFQMLSEENKMPQQMDAMEIDYVGLMGY